MMIHSCNNNNNNHNNTINDEHNKDTHWNKITCDNSFFTRFHNRRRIEFVPERSLIAKDDSNHATTTSSSSDSSDSSSSSSSSDSSSDEEVMNGQDKKIKTRGVVNDELFDRFIMLAQELNSRKQQRKSRKTRPDKSVRKSKKRV